MLPVTVNFIEILYVVSFLRHMYECMYVHVCVYMYLCMYVCVCMYALMHSCICM